MVASVAQRIRTWIVLILFPAAALAFVVVAGVGLRMYRPPRSDTAENDPRPAADDAEPGSVQLPSAAVQTAAGIEVASVQSRTLDNSISCNGSASFNQNKYVKVAPKAEGILAKIHVDVGSAVRAKDVLAVINSQDTGDLKSSYLKAIIHEEHLRWQLDRFRVLSDSVAAKNIFETKHLLEEQVTDTLRIKERLDGFGFSPEQVEQIVKDKDIRIQLPVLAPRDGTIVWRQAVEGEAARTDHPLFAIADLDTMWVHLNVYEHNLPHIRLGQPVRFFPDGLPGQGFEGHVIWISPEVDAQTRTIQLRAEVVNRQGALRANMFGKGELLLDSGPNPLVVPQSAVQTHRGNHVVFVKNPENGFEVRQVSVGRKDDQFWEVTTGLKPGEKVATTGSFLLKSNLENADFGKIE